MYITVACKKCFKETDGKALAVVDNDTGDVYASCGCIGYGTVSTTANDNQAIADNAWNRLCEIDGDGEWYRIAPTAYKMMSFEGPYNPIDDCIA